MLPDYAVTPNGILLTYLRIKSYSERTNIFPLSKIAKEIKEIEDSSDEICLFGFYESDPANNPDFIRALENLRFYRFVEFDKERNEIKITGLGKLFGESFDLPPPIDRYVAEEDKLKERLASSL